MNLNKKYYAKLMLAGEYGVITGSEALTMPLRLFSALLANREDSTDHEKMLRSVDSLRGMISYINSLPRNSFYATPDTAALDEILKNGYFIKSSIPEGYGIGSSGAVTALIYDQFFTKSEDLSLAMIRKDLSTIESCFHGKSSGVDAMTSYTGEILHFLPDGDIETVDKDPLQTVSDYRFFLVDSKAVFDTGPLVQHYLQMMNKTEFSKIIREDYFTLISKFIRTITGKSTGDPALIFRAISDLQWNYFRKMIPEQMEDIWINGQVSNTYYLKLNGSGGGYLLGITYRDSEEAVEEMMPGLEIIWL